MSPTTGVDGFTMGKPRNEKLRAAGIVLMAFGLVSLITAIFFARQSGAALVQSLPAEGGIVGPVEITKENTVLHITVQQSFSQDSWSYIEGDVLDAEQEPLFSFGDELWRESGYDSDGAWSESDSTYDLKVTIPEKGTHYLELTAELAAPSTASSMSIRVEPQAGSTVPFIAAGIIGLILGLILHEMATGAIIRALGKLGEES